LDIYGIFIQIVVLVFSVIVHEVSHGFVAYKLGDPTAKDMGRLTLNPLPHIDPFMSILMPAFLIFSHAGFIIGGAKPVPINPMYFRHHRRDIMLTSLAGPGSNLLLALVSVLLLKITRMVPVLEASAFNMLFFYGIVINVGLALFNLLPIPPLDGSKVLVFFLPPKAEIVYYRLEPYGIFILIGLMMIGGFNVFFAPLYTFVIKLFSLML
jgi:Zn-dependent protease